MHELVAANLFSILVLAIVVLGLHENHNKSKSSRALVWVCLSCIVCSAADVATYLVKGPDIPNDLIEFFWLVSYSFGSIALLAFVRYWYTYITEKTVLNNLHYRIPCVVLIINSLYTFCVGISGKIVVIEGGYPTITGGMPVPATLVQLFFVIYFPVIAFNHRKAIGLRAVVLIGTFGALPAVATLLTLLTGCLDYSYPSASFSVLVIYVLLENNLAFEKEFEYQTKLSEINREQESRYNIIKSMCSIYFVSYYIDIVNDTYIELDAKQSIRSVIEPKGKAQESLYKACDQLIIPAFKERMREFWDLSTINERLKDKKAVSCRYIGVSTGWSNAYLIAGDRDENGNLLHIFFAARTIHEEKALEDEQTRKLEEAIKAAENASKAKTTFLFSMSHDIRTPMNAIIGFANLLEKHLDDEDRAKDYLEKIHTSSDFLLSLINSVLEFARIESGEVVLEETVSETGSITKEISTIFYERMKQKGITFISSVECKHKYIYTDSVRTKEIFLNLVSNAYKYTPAGGTVTLSVQELPSDREGYAIMQTTIADTGIGMSKEFLPHLFDEFAREKTVTENKIEGTGLGMPIVKKLVKLMGGTITVESELGKGTIYTMVLPHRIGEPEGIECEYMPAKNENRFEGRHILLAEDNDLNAEIAIEILEDAGIKVERAEDGIICVDILQKAKPDYYDLVLMDVQMPNMDGYKATQIIRRMEDEQKRNIPVIAMTANAFDEDKQNAMNAGMNAHLAKPIRIDELMSVLSKYLQ